ncbi:hypothetical protein SAMN02910278_00330 [Peptostreptococcus sp. D1]|nr:hypothetical protein SAMN02910278_00330 [Peptostreptococcus sp. D1]
MKTVDEIIAFTLQKLKKIDSKFEVIYFDLTRESTEIPAMKVLMTLAVQTLAFTVTVVN